MGRWYIVRHGETEWNAEGRMQGHTDVGLSEVGRQQARALARRLAGVTIDVAYSSDLRRAGETARIVLEKREVPLHFTQQLRERCMGVFEGLTVEERKTRYPEMFAASLVNDLDFAPTGGESMRRASVRMAGLAADLREHELDRDVLIVGHGGSMRPFIVALLELPLAATWRFVMANCGLSIVDTYPDNAVLRLYNDTSHLDGVGSNSE